MKYIQNGKKDGKDIIQNTQFYLGVVGVLLLYYNKSQGFYLFGGDYRMDENRKIYVIGHKNPDTDSICSAIAYADFKRKTAPGNFIAKRAGQINEETQYVLNRFQVSAPGYLSSVYTQVRDVEIRKTQGVEESISLKKAWGLMLSLIHI